MNETAERTTARSVLSGPAAFVRAKKNFEPPLWQSVQPLTPSAWRAGRTRWAIGQVSGRGGFAGDGFERALFPDA